MKFWWQLLSQQMARELQLREGKPWTILHIQFGAIIDYVEGF